MGRREMREHIFKLLFLREFNEAEEMPQQIKLYFDAMEELAPQSRPTWKTSMERYRNIWRRSTTY